MTDVLVIQNNRIEGSGVLGTLLKNDGFNVKSVNAKYEKLPDDNYSLLVILGAPESANDTIPYINAEQGLIRKFVQKEKPVLGICLGSQLIAKAFGAKVYRGSKTEIGFYHDLQIDNNSEFFKGFSNPFTVFHWHSDSFDLPIGAIRLAHSKHYSNQAIQYGSAIGAQFHMEIDEKMLNLWLDNTEEKIAQIPGIDPNIIRKDIHDNIGIVKQNMERFYKNFKLFFNF